METELRKDERERQRWMNAKCDCLLTTGVCLPTFLSDCVRERKTDRLRESKKRKMQREERDK